MLTMINEVIMYMLSRLLATAHVCLNDRRCPSIAFKTSWTIQPRPSNTRTYVPPEQPLAKLPS